MEPTKNAKSRKHHHRAVNCLNAYLRAKPDAARQIARLELLVNHYEKLLNDRRKVRRHHFRQAA